MLTTLLGQPTKNTIPDTYTTEGSAQKRESTAKDGGHYVRDH